MHIFKEGNTIKSDIFKLNEIIFSRHAFVVGNISKQNQMYVKMRHSINNVILF